MKAIRHCLALAAIVIALPVRAQDKPASPSTHHTTEPDHSPSAQFITAGSPDPDTLLLQIDLKVTLQQYERLRTEAAEAELQLEIGELATPDPRVEEARKALAEMKVREKSQRVSKEELKEADDNYKIAQIRAEDNLKRRYQVLRSMADRARADAYKLAETLAKRAKDAARIQPQPQPQPSTPQG